MSAQRAENRATQNYPPQMDGAKTEVYKTIGDTKLQVYIFNPDHHQASDARPAMVFFFGGGWRTGSPKQFEQQCRYFAARGMVAIAADYRVASRHNTKAVQCVADGKSAIRWVRSNAKRLGIDPDRIVAGGGSAGGHVAACTAVLEEFDEATEDGTISSAPNAAILFNPAVVLARVPGQAGWDEDRINTLQDRMGVEPARLSPFHQVSKGLPPMLIFHGKADTTVPYATAEAFAQAMTKAGNRCELSGFEGQPHGFFNFGRGGNQHFVETVRQADVFLHSLGYLKGPPTVDAFLKEREG